MTQRSILGKRSPALILVAVAMTGFALQAKAQTANAISGSSSTSLNMHVVQTRFLPSNANTGQDALKNVAISAAGQQVAGSVAGIAGGKLLTIPGVGGLPVAGAMAAINVFRKKTVKGFTIDYLLGTSAVDVLTRGDLAFSIDTAKARMAVNGLQVSPPLLIHLLPGGSDAVRVLRTIHLSYKEPGGSPQTADVLGTEQDLITCNSEERGGDRLLLTPKTQLLSGEYAIVLPSKTAIPGIESKETWTLVWDFQIQ